MSPRLVSRRPAAAERAGGNVVLDPPVAAAPAPAPAGAEHHVPIAGQLGEVLVRRSLITEDALREALATQRASGKRLGAALVEVGLLTEDDLVAALAEQLGLQFLDLNQARVSEDAEKVLPETVARARLAVPLATHNGDRPVVVLGDPSHDALESITAAAARPVRFAVASPAAVRRAIDGAYHGLVEVDGAPVIALVERLITQAVRDRASDIHIEPQGESIRVRIRIDGALHETVTLPATLGPAVVSRLKVLAGMNIVERRRPQDGQLSLEVDGRAVDVRVATVATIWGEKCVLRLLDKARPLYRMDQLGMPEATHGAFSKLVRSPFGMVICAGPTGSGKTTTLYATLAELNESSRNIMTIEDPVEYVFPSINQIQANEVAGLTFATGLKSILRQDPDIILVGECRDVETARIAVQSALTGHLVLTTLHATDSVAALHRLLDMGIESFLVASSVVGIVGQRLVRRVCEECRAKYTPTAEERAYYHEMGGPERPRFVIGKGCNACSGTGYRDRIGVYELLRVTPELKRLVVGWATQEELRRMAVSQGMRTLQQEAMQLVAGGVTTVTEVIRNIYAS